MPPEFWQGVEQFNTGQFYACHDTLEALWIEALEPEKTLYQGILQVAVALYHLGNSNLRGATILLGEGCNRLRRYPSVFAGIDIDEFLDQSIALLKVLQYSQPESIVNLKLGEDAAFPIPRIVLVD
ncbi:hypothetical protein NIES4101_77620 [Calothrix sp. NIES-4101]|nr:hypothetical protein NIES4101_77620 [Calothrix sp. NIES-4101]